MMLAEQLLLAKNVNLPTREKEVLHALETMHEPRSVVLRRRARRLASRAMGEMHVRTADGEIATFAGVLSDGESQGRGGWSQGMIPVDGPSGDMKWSVVKADGSGVVSMTSDAFAQVPAELRRYLTTECEPEMSYDTEVFVKTLMCTGGIYRLDGGEDGTQGVLDSIWGGLPIGELPPLPYPRMWFEARDASGNFVPLWKGSPPDQSWNAVDTGAIWGMGISEVIPGQSWGVAVLRQQDWTYHVPQVQAEAHEKRGPNGEKPVLLSSVRYERIDATDLALTPRSPDDMFVSMESEEQDWAASEIAYRGAMAAWALVLADIVTARNVDRREAVMHRKVRKQLERHAPGGRFAPRLYNVSIATATDDPKDDTHRSLSVRFLVRGHWRVSVADHSRWIDSKEAHCVWIAAYVKGPAFAPWKGRPIYVEPRPGAVGRG